MSKQWHEYSKKERALVVDWLNNNGKEPKSGKKK